jgi:hypothetical protein
LAFNSSLRTSAKCRGLSYLQHFETHTEPHGSEPNTESVLNSSFNKNGAVMTEQNKPQRPRGFAAMGVEQQKRIASAGGQAAHRNGKAHQFTAAEARVAGAKGRAARLAKRQSSTTLVGHFGSVDDEISERESELLASDAV